MPSAVRNYFYPPTPFPSPTKSTFSHAPAIFLPGLLNVASLSPPPTSPRTFSLCSISCEGWLGVRGLRVRPPGLCVSLLYSPRPFLFFFLLLGFGRHQVPTAVTPPGPRVFQSPPANPAQLVPSTDITTTSIQYYCSLTPSYMSSGSLKTRLSPSLSVSLPRPFRSCTVCAMADQTTSCACRGIGRSFNCFTLKAMISSRTCKADKT